MDNALIECVPNISEGRNPEIIRLISEQVERIEGVKLLDVDPGKATNRTVITFAGSPQNVIDAAFLVIKSASELIDMRAHKGEHPRFGATDVCPLIPISGISMEEVVVWANKLAKRVGDELGIPIYMYENAAKTQQRKNLAHCRSGQYEGLKAKLSDPNWKPDYGSSDWAIASRTGAIAIGARDFLVAYNVNLNTTSTRRANAIAFDLREAGRVKREGDPYTGKIIEDANGEPLRVPGKLKSVKGIGWYIEEYGIAQLSLNLTNIGVTPVHIAFEEAVKSAQERGIRVTGSELVGLIPLKSMIDAANYFLHKQNRSLGISETEKIKIAVKSLGLDDLKPFNPQDKIIEYVLNKNKKAGLVDLTLSAFSDETASESPAPGGGSIAAYMGVLGVALGQMVANLSAHKRGWDSEWEFFSSVAEKAEAIRAKLLYLVDEDTKAFNQIMAGFALPKGNTKETEVRQEAIQKATLYASEIPLQVMEVSLSAMDVLELMAEKGLKSSVSDAGVGVLAIRSAVLGAFLNVQINIKDLKNQALRKKLHDKSFQLRDKAIIKEKSILDMVHKAIGLSDYGL